MWRRRWWVLVASMFLGVGCGQASYEPPGYMGSLVVTLEGAGFAGMTSVRINVIGPIHDCTEGGVAEQVFSVADAPASLRASFEVLPGRYRLCLTGLDSQRKPLQGCFATTPAVMVANQQTTEVSAALACKP